MRRVFASLLASAVLVAFVGCNHTAGVCDCDNGHGCCDNGWPHHAAAVAAPADAAPAPEQLKEMPKASDKGT
jgi:hypothetical protein